MKPPHDIGRGKGAGGRAVRVRDVTADEGNRLLRIVRRSSKSVATWRRATYTRPHAVRHLLAAHDRRLGKIVDRANVA